jgi:phosphatidate cytidylyltransferase
VTLLRRIVTSTFLCALILGILFRGGETLFSALVLVFTGVALYEFFTLLRHAKIPCFRLFGTAMGMIIPAVVYLEQGPTLSGEILFLIIGCFFLFILQFSRKDENEQALIGISLTLFGILYISWFLSFLIKMRFLPNGVFWIAYILTVTKMADIGAYSVGSLLGRHSLIPHVSPKKSVEGLIGGLALSALASAAFTPVLPVDWTVSHLLVLGVLIGVVGQIGDLSESLMKRFCHAKDSGGLLPGMGGVMDAVDSVLFTVPIFYFHLRLFS